MDPADEIIDKYFEDYKTRELIRDTLVSNFRERVETVNYNDRLAKQSTGGACLDIQALLFNRDDWTPDKARRYMKRNKYEPIKRVHKTDKYLRYRLKHPKKTEYRTIKMPENVLAVIEL